MGDLLGADRAAWWYGCRYEYKPPRAPLQVFLWYTAATHAIANPSRLTMHVALLQGVYPYKAYVAGSRTHIQTTTSAAHPTPKLVLLFPDALLDGHPLWCQPPSQVYCTDSTPQ